MFIKNLIISSPTEIIRDIKFNSGLNLIIDETSTDDSKSTGNNVGKTTVLKLIDFCLGAEAKIIYIDIENKGEVYTLVKDFLTKSEIIITLILTEKLDDPGASQLEIKRNFLPGKKTIRTINGRTILDKDFENELQSLIMPEKKLEKPTFRQVISHNIRYSDEKINNTLKTLNKYTNDIEYESLYLYLLGVTSFNQGAEKQVLISKINQEENFKERLEKKQAKTTYEMKLALIENEIEILNKKKKSFNLNETLEQDLDLLNSTKYKINKISSEISKLEIRKKLIEESSFELEHSISNIDLQQLGYLYNEVSANISGIQKTFEDLVTYHDKMVVEKVKYISQDLPNIHEKLKVFHEELTDILKEEKKLTEKVAKGDSFKELEKVISELNEKHRIKGEYESVISQLNEVEKNINILNNKIESINKNLFSDDFEILLKEKIKKFNILFSSISQDLYGEQYGLTYKIETKKSGKYYKFSAFNENISSGKKQGEILCFDLAYLKFADQEQIPHLNFLLNDKKELMHANQLIKISNFLQSKNIQLVISVLKDKLPNSVLNNAHIAVELSQKSKLFKI